LSLEFLYRKKPNLSFGFVESPHATRADVIVYFLAVYFKLDLFEIRVVSSRCFSVGVTYQIAGHFRLAAHHTNFGHN
jgi:hypothetical protein